MLRAAQTISSLLLVLASSGCFLPWRVAEPVKFTVIDAKTEAPIPNAKVVYLACDVHDSSCQHAHLVRSTSSANGAVKIDGHREWAFLVPVPGNIPVPNHFVAIWAPGYSAFAYGQYGDSVASRKRAIARKDILDALNEIPDDHASSAPSLNPSRELEGGTIRLRRQQ
jgi:hypothetical protein